MYASVSSGFSCVNLRYFFLPSDSNKILPTKNGVALTVPMWENLYKFAPQLRELDPRLKGATLCVNGLDHLNQMGYFTCPECCPFHEPYAPLAELPIYPTPFDPNADKLD
jgi:hypothetical protein